MTGIGSKRQKEDLTGIIEPPKRWMLGVLSGDPNTSILREYYNFYRELEGLPSLESGVIVAEHSSTLAWVYDMVKKHNGHLLEEYKNGRRYGNTL